MRTLILMILAIGFNTYGIYGVDNRKDFYELENPKLKELSKAVAFQVQRHRELSGWKFLKRWTILTDSFYNKNVCSDQDFSYQPAMLNNCTGVLVGPKLLLTAGNCMTEHYCWNDLYYWMFNYSLKSKDNFSNKRLRKNFYTCKKVIKRVYDPKNANSYTLLELNKVVEGVKPVKVNFNDNLSIGDELITMGHIDGLPLKIAPDSQVKDMNEKLFILNSDIAGSSKGSPVFNAQTYELEAIQIYGSNNYESTTRGCKEVPLNKYDDAKELAIKTNFLKEYLR